jgi:hypothetical protein
VRGVHAVPSCVFVAAVLLASCRDAGKNLPHLDHSNIAIAASISHWDNDPSNSHLILKFSNASSETKTLVLPCPLNENATTFGSPERPTLVLSAKELVTSNEEGFVLTDWSNLAGDTGKTLVLKPGESAEVPFPLASFFSWGHAGPTRNMGFVDCLRPGEHGVSVRAIIAYSDVEPQKADHLESPPIELQCDFPEWLFASVMRSNTEKGTAAEPTPSSAVLREEGTSPAEKKSP